MVKRISRAVAAAVGVAVAAATLVAAPARADQLACGPTQTDLIVVPNKAYDIRVWATVCVISSGTSREAAIKIEFNVRGIPSDNPFTLFRFGSRLEHRNSTRAIKTCDYTARANDPRRHYGLICKSGRYSSSVRGNWTGDGYLEWEIIGDGKGHLFWNFPDSPAIS